MTAAPSRGLAAVLTTQFLSALADNAILFAAITLLRHQSAPAWQTPLLQEFFVLAFIVLAPFVGPFADGRPKGQVMLAANAIKLLGALGLLAGMPPLVAYGIIGIGAATYSPAKYGILSELLPTDKLVKANSMMEGSTIIAILLGAIAGGMLADNSPTLAISGVIGCYLAAALTNLLIPVLPAAAKHAQPRTALRDFWVALTTLWRTPAARFTLLGTSVFWGAGSTLRFLLIAWVPAVLGIMDTQTPANLSGVVAIGIALGAGAAARFVTLDNVGRALPAGIALAIAILGFAHVSSLPLAIGMLLVIGACGGFYVVPLNAMLQHVGHDSVGAGKAIAIQNFFENLAMLLMVGGYTVLANMGMTPVQAATLFGIFLLGGISLVARLPRA